MRWKPSSLWLSLCLFGAILSAAPSAWSQKAASPTVAVLPPAFSAGTFEEIEGKPLITVKINDVLETRVLVDCGAWTSLLSRESVQALHLVLQKVTIEDTALEQGNLAKLALGKAALTDVKVCLDYTPIIETWNKAHPQTTIGGVLGQDILEHHALGLDFATHTYGFWIGGKITAQDGETFNSIVCAPQGDTAYAIPPGGSLRIGLRTLKNPTMRRTVPQSTPLEKPKAVGSTAARKEFSAKLYDQGLFFTYDSKGHLLPLRIGKDSPAEKAGLKNDDELLAVNGKTPKAIGEAMERGGAAPDMRSLRVTVRRKGEFEKRVFTVISADAVVFHFSGDSPPFPDEYLRPPTSATFKYLDPIQDHEFIERAQRLLEAEMAKYPAGFTARNLKDIYVFKDLAQNNVSVGGFGWADHQRLYIQNDMRPGPIAEVYFSLTLHHELAHILLANHPASFSRERWQKLNPPGFHYGAGGLDSIRGGSSGGTQLDTASWEKGFARVYGLSDFDEDFACICEGIFCGDPRFWEAVDRVEILKNKVKMAIDFYRSLDATMTEAYFRGLPPLPKIAVGAIHRPTTDDRAFHAAGRQAIVSFTSAAGPAPGSTIRW